MMQFHAAVIGAPVLHSLSPAMFNAEFAREGNGYAYEAIEVTAETLPAFIQRVRDNEFSAFSVTMPLKELVLQFVDVIDDAARSLHAANSVCVIGGKLTAFNTDGEGCCEALHSVGGAHFDGTTCVVFGAGGTARSVSLALLRRGARVKIINRSSENANRAVALLLNIDASFDVAVGTSHDIATAQILVNTTPVGMGGTQAEQAIVADLSGVRNGATVLDAVYQPLDTAFLRAARARGARTVDGLWMLVHQAVRQHRLWFGTDASAPVMREAAERELLRRQK